jgi:hypothetical protein
MNRSNPEIQKTRVNTDTSRFFFDYKTIFTYTRDNHQFQSPMYSAYCPAVLPDGTLCNTQTTRIHPFCFECTERIFHVRVAPSNQGPDAGLGLFAWNPECPRPKLMLEGLPVFRAGDFVCHYMVKY